MACVHYFSASLTDILLFLCYKRVRFCKVKLRIHTWGVEVWRKQFTEPFASKTVSWWSSVCQPWAHGNERCHIFPWEAYSLVEQSMYIYHYNKVDHWKDIVNELTKVAHAWCTLPNVLRSDNQGRILLWVKTLSLW